MVNDIAAKNLTDQLTTPLRKKRFVTPCSSTYWTLLVQGSSDEEEACENYRKINNTMENAKDLSSIEKAFSEIINILFQFAKVSKILG
uniref:Uncharacterized protein n=1 Tax=Romanomermis culicivorax TaxID=13658 RepID=A0A915ID63_ROMCU